MVGFSLDLNQGNISVPQQHICKLQGSLRKASPSMTVRQLASIVGQIVSMSLGLSSVARLMTRSLYTIINCRTTWNDKIVWTEEAWAEMKFWENNIESLNGKEMRRNSKVANNQNVVRIIEHGSRKPRLQEMAVNILSTLMQTAIRLAVA